MEPRDIEILECTLRDGSYAVDFKFTEADTALLTSVLARIGFRWIEVGHGLGLGASDAGKGRMPTSDEEIIRASKSAGGEASIGMFFIPAIASIDLLGPARDAGLDFVRVGENATVAETAFPAIEKANELGLVPAMNFMKSYAITPKEFGRKAKAAHEAGARMVYLVDSVGGMMPEDVEAYLGEAASACPCPLGFHSHDNLKMAIANSVQAYKSGARFTDSTVYGLGRSAGNAASEVLVAVYEKMGVRTGIDLFALMDAAETYMAPLMSQIEMHNMLAVSMGVGQFHSSFLPQVAATARKYNVDLKRLVVKMGQLDPVDLDKDALERTAKSMENTDSGTISQQLIAFDDRQFGGRRINTSSEAVTSLVEDMTVTCAKRRNARPVLELVPAPGGNDDLVLPELLMVDDQVVLGRVVFGSFPVLEDVVNQVQRHISLFLTDHRNFEWAADLDRRISEIVGEERVVPIDGESLRMQFVVETLLLAAHRYGLKTLLLFGLDDKLLSALSQRRVFSRVFLYDRRADDAAQHPEVVHVRSFEDWLELNLQVDLVVFAHRPSEDDYVKLPRLLSSHGKAVSLDLPPPPDLQNAFKNSLLSIDPNLGYAGLLSRILASKAFLSGSPGT